VVVTVVVVWHAVAPGTVPGAREAAAAAGVGASPEVHLVLPVAGADEVAPASAAVPSAASVAPVVAPAVAAPTVAPPVTPITARTTPTPAVSAGPVTRSRVETATTGTGPVPPAVQDPSVVAIAVVASLPLYQAPGDAAPFRALPSPNDLGAPLVLLVAGTQDGWVKAYVPIRPNGSTAWVPAGDVTLTSVREHIVVDLAARRLTLYSDNAPVFQTPVAPGAPSSPTPTGLFFVTYIVRLTDPGGPYGPYALGLSAFSDTYFSFEGGPGQIAIHGTDQPSVIGTDASNGCVRLRNDSVATLAEQVPWGIPVEIEN
jgi:lipoprotein-anchoring transpeptidase ErfK/SrfK